MPSPTEQFIEWAAHDRNRSPHTIARYRAVLNMIDHPETATREQIEAWWATRYEHSTATRANDLACLRSFYKWATRFDIRDDDPTRRLDAPTAANHVPRPIGEADLDRLLYAAKAQPDLGRAIALGAYAGFRVSEVANLDWADINQDTRRMYVRGKGGKERSFGIGPVLLDKLLPDVGGNVVTAGGTPYAGTVLQRKVNRFIKAQGIDHTFHDLRKRGASLAIAKTGDIYAVAKAFGWSSIETASFYATVSDDTLDKIAAAMV